MSATPPVKRPADGADGAAKRTKTDVAALSPAPAPAPAPGGLTPDQIERIKEEAKRRLEEIKQRAALGAARPPPQQAVGAAAAVPTLSSITVGRPMALNVRPSAVVGATTAAPAIPMLPAVGAVAAARPANAMALAMERARIAAMASAQGATPNKEAAKPSAVKIDKLGRMVDEKGNLIELKPREDMSTLKINIRKAAEKEEKKKAKEAVLQAAEAEKERVGIELDPTKNPFFDPKIKTELPTAPRERRKALQFFEAGVFERQAQQQRAKAQIEKLKREIDEKARRAGMDQLVDTSVNETAARMEANIPTVEWWDEFFLKTGTYDGVDNQNIRENSPEDPFRRDLATIFVHHPVPCKPPLPDAEVKPKELFLTKEERKKLRRIRRQEAQREEQEKIRLGLIEPPQPKAKLSNFMRVFGNEAIQEPTKIEDIVRSQVEERLSKHLAANAERKLTPQQRHEKFWAKLDDDRKRELRVLVFRTTSLSSKLNRKKISLNAQQYRLTGCSIMSPALNIVVVEGGIKALKRYKKLMLQRIKWNDTEEDDQGGSDVEEGDLDDDDDDDKGPNGAPNGAPSSLSLASSSKGPNECVLVWEGILKQATFKRFTHHECATEMLAREFIKKFRIEQYWEAAKNYVSGTH